MITDHTYYITFAGIMGSIMSLFLVVLYQKLFAIWRFKSAISMTICTCAVVAMADIIVINRWNTNIGIPDKMFFMFGNALFITAVFLIPNVLTGQRRAGTQRALTGQLYLGFFRMFAAMMTLAGMMLMAMRKAQLQSIASFEQYFHANN